LEANHRADSNRDASESERNLPIDQISRSKKDRVNSNATQKPRQKIRDKTKLKFQIGGCNGLRGKRCLPARVERQHYFREKVEMGSFLPEIELRA
jgi:hypothetical protein